MEDPRWSSLFLKDCISLEGPKLGQFVENCILWEGLTLEQFVEVCVHWEGPQAGAGSECEKSSP